MSERNRETSTEPISDGTATRDIGGAYGGLAGTMPDAAERQENSETRAPEWLQHGTAGAESSVGQRPATVSDPNAGSGEPANTPLEYNALPGSGAPTPMQSPDADKTSTGRTDQRDSSQDAISRNMGNNWTGETEPDREFRENPPTRGGETGTEANDAF